jgi:hypothetical protein
MIEAYPLYYPKGKPRTASWRREQSRFNTTFGAARDSLMEELRRLGAKNIVLSTNIELRRDGLPYASAKEPDDPGAAVYFLYQGKQYCFACDRWKLVKENIQAICKTIEAIRGINRWGTGDMLAAAFKGFQQLPEPEKWWAIIGVNQGESLEVIEATYRAKARECHPDRGGSNEAMARLNNAIEQARKEKASDQ